MHFKKSADANSSFSLLKDQVPAGDDLWLEIYAPVLILRLYNTKDQLMLTKAGRTGIEIWPLYNLPAGSYRIDANTGESQVFSIK